jgi:hypothetical protein
MSALGLVRVSLGYHVSHHPHVHVGPLLTSGTIAPSGFTTIVSAPSLDVA